MATDDDVNALLCVDVISDALARVVAVAVAVASRGVVVADGAPRANAMTCDGDRSAKRAW